MERAQLKTAESIKKLALMHSVVAVRLLQLRDAAKDKQEGEKTARGVIEEVTVRVVEKLSGKKTTEREAVLGADSQAWRLAGAQE